MYMIINNVRIKNYRNIENCDIKLNKLTTVIGANNSGKTNFLNAISLPILVNENSEKLTYIKPLDINENAKKNFYDYIKSNIESIKKSEELISDFSVNCPEIIITLNFKCDEGSPEVYYIKDLSYELDGNIFHGIEFKYYPKSYETFYKYIRDIIKNIDIDNFDKIKNSLIPAKEYGYTIRIPHSETKVSYDVLREFRYTYFNADRDSFSSTNKKIGSSSLVKLIESNISPKGRVEIEEKYFDFFEKVKTSANMDSTFNFSENIEMENIKSFFDKVSIVPNTPELSSVINNVTLGYQDKSLANLGLGYRNMFLLLTLLGVKFNQDKDIALPIFLLEEPEAHLCYNNKIIISEYLLYCYKNSHAQNILTTHCTDFVNKLDLTNIIIMSEGNAISLNCELENDELDYLSKNPNFDIFKIFYSNKCILVEGLTEELLINAFLQTRGLMSGITVISFHKGFKNIIETWHKIHKDDSYKLGVMRDYDNQANAQNEHEELVGIVGESKLKVTTTIQYTLEDEFVKTGNNYEILNEYFYSKYEWDKSSSESELIDKWKKEKAQIMLTLAQDIRNRHEKLNDLSFPKYITDIIDFLIQETKVEKVEANNEG